MPPIPPDLPARLFPDPLLSQARAVVRAGRVAAAGAEPAAGAQVITGRVNGEEGRVYRVYGRLAGDELEGDCSCPLGSDCEHLAAVLLTLAEGAPEPARAAEPPPSAPPPAPEAGPDWNWSAEAYPPGVDQRLIYLLDQAPAANRLRVRLCSARSDGAGGVTGPATPFAPERIQAPYLPAWLLPSDRRLLRELLAGSLLLDGALLPGPDTGALLAAMLTSGRCYREEAGRTALALAPARAARLRWETLPSGDQRLVCLTDAGPALVCPPCYLDPAAGVAGPLATGVAPELLARLLAHLPLPAGQAERLRAELAATGLPDLPLPQPHPLVELPAAPPTPQLTLYGLPAAEGAADGRPAARLAFRYGPLTLDWQETGDQRFDGGRVWRFARDERFEQACLRRLTGVGLRPLAKLPAPPPAAADPQALVVPDPAAELPIWRDLQARLPAWEAEGWELRFEPGFSCRTVTAEGWYGEAATSPGDWFELELGVVVEGERIPLLPLLLAYIAALPKGGGAALPAGEGGVPLRLDAGRIIEIPAPRLRTILTTLLELFEPGAPLAEGRLRLPRARAADLGGLAEAGWGLATAPELKALAGQLREFTGIPPVAPPPGLATGLRPYQQAGLEWMQFLRAFGFGGILADDMGLGKTVQTLAHLLTELAAGRLDRPALVVAPTSLMFNWRAEAERLAPGLPVLTLHGPDRRERFARIPEHRLVLTSYALLPRDFELLAAQEWHLLILDEAQALKNPRAQLRQCAAELPARHRIALTGTPMENHLGELWSLMDLVTPGLLGSESAFQRQFRQPIEKGSDEALRGERQTLLARRVRPFMLRRSKGEVARDLPALTEMVQSAVLEEEQRDLYETIRLAMHEKVREAIERAGLEQSRIVVLDALLKLRQVCCDPRLLPEGRGEGVPSAKLALLMELLPEMVEEGRRVLLFSQFARMLGLMGESLREAGIPFVELTGATRDRESPVRRFQAGEVPLFLISLKAGGVGLNLTAADTVIHYDPWWNPAVEAQATGRAHRIGQRNKVFVYRLITEGTVEQKILALQSHKRALAEALFAGTGSGRLRAEDLAVLFEPLG